ncbi:ROK family protein [Brevifollis gellanilyticus]|uniref:Transcriptional regulator n=1 Tax=Brevifollis gellanilyticus TaxID=748831 RepID=A0A512MH24_9BACT|nr:ROK family protein [Brevifollis gellanilyticus]GEP46024.1 transcriptional regulator [Brevifollis gellanilyticus]
MPKKKDSTPKAAAKVKPAKPVKQKDIPFWIGFDLGGTKMLACVLDKNYQVLGTARKSTNGSDGQMKGRKKIVTAIHEAIEAAGVNPKGLQGIGIGCPGLVNPEKGVLINAPNLNWNNVQLGTMLKGIFKKPVVVLNDVDAGTFGEYKLGAGKGSRSLLGVFPGTGVGAGFVYNGQLVMGRAVSAMELGMIYLPGTHLGSPHDGTVLLEDLTSRLALASQAGVACYRGQLPELDKKTRGNLRDIRSKALANALRGGDEAGAVMFRNSIRYLGMGVAAVVNLLAPDHVTLGGGLVEELPTVYLNMLKAEVNRFAVPGLARGVKYSIAKLGGTAVAIGSVAWLREQGGGA